MGIWGNLGLEWVVSWGSLGLEELEMILFNAVRPQLVIKTGSTNSEQTGRLGFLPTSLFQSLNDARSFGFFSGGFSSCAEIGRFFGRGEGINHITLGYLYPWTRYNNSLNDMFQLPNVPRPRSVNKNLHGLRVNIQQGFLMFEAGMFHKVLDQ